MYKQVIVIRRDLGMGRGKAAAQAAHASCEAVFRIIESRDRRWLSWLDEWRRSGQEKVVLRVDSEAELIDVYRKALEAGLPTSLIIDAGRTQLKPGTKTAVAIGPAPEVEVDRITGHLKLY
ncbi:MAG: peptidyl-tRNA hydrolase Pth2 [Desulfurococcales archaeon]|nr:peptidyl-tRNA hydrolase Pth2 [Desulfurococcales archaeon]